MCETVIVNRVSETLAAAAGDVSLAQASMCVQECVYEQGTTWPHTFVDPA